jgi:hypothetical protein
MFRTGLGCIFAIYRVHSAERRFLVLPLTVVCVMSATIRFITLVAGERAEPLLLTGADRPCEKPAHLGSCDTR